MSKKLYVPILIAVVAAVVVGLWAADAALAKSGGLSGRQRRGVLGQVTEIKKNEFTIQKRDNTPASFHVSDQTIFRDREGNTLSFADLKEGGWVVVGAPQKPGEGQKPEARRVVILPEDFDPEKMGGAGGVVESVDTAKNQFTVKNRKGEAATVSVNDETLFKGQASDLAALKDGMLATARGETLADGGLMADVVRSSFPIKRAGGEVLSVDEAAATFTLKARRSGEEITFLVNDETKFRSKDGKISGLADLKAGMVIVVIGSQAEGAANPTAHIVAAAEKEDLPKFDKRFMGKVVSVDGKNLVIETRRGEQVTVQVTGDTKFRSRGQVIDSLEDLQAGMAVVVGVKELGNGEYQAQLIIVGKANPK